MNVQPVRDTIETGKYGQVGPADQPGQDGQNMAGRRGHMGQDNRERTTMAGEPGCVNWGKVKGQDSWNRSKKKGRHDISAWTCLPCKK